VEDRRQVGEPLALRFDPRDHSCPNCMHLDLREITLLA
jgi:hypothetical protein